MGSPYTLLFGQRLYQTFREAYLLVDDQTRKKFIDLFKTWKNAKTSSGLPLFPEEPVQKIEQFLVKATSIYQQVSSRPQVSVPMLLGTVDRLLYLINQRAALTPGDKTIQTKIEIITQLKYALQNERMTPDALLGVKNQLEDMTRSEERQLRETPPIRSPTVNSPVVKTPPLAQPQPNLYNIFNTMQNNKPTEQANKPSTAVNTNSNAMGSMLTNILNMNQPGKTPTPPTNDLSSLLSSLQKHGLVKPVTPVVSSSLVPTVKVPSASVLSSLLQRGSKSATPQPEPALSMLEKELSQFDLSGKFLSMDPSGTYTTLLVTAKPNKCGTCGKRFTNTVEGQAQSRKHLDWHFRINKKVREGSIVQSRSWYLDDEEFVQFRDEEMLGSVDAVEASHKEAEKPKQERHYVIVPTDADMGCLCPVCKEILRAKFDDDLGEWIWDGAVERQGRVFHYSCFEETQRSSKRARELDFDMMKSVIKSVKLEDGSRSES